MKNKLTNYPELEKVLNCALMRRFDELDAAVQEVYAELAKEEPLGHHEPWEVPDILAEGGLISSEESSELTDRFEAGEKPEDVLPPPLRVLWRKHFSTSSRLQLN